MANKKIVTSNKGSFETNVADRMSTQFDQKHDVKDTFTLRIMSSMRGKSDDAVRAAIMLAMKKSNSKSANVKVRFTQEYAQEHMEELLALAKLIQLENEARIYEMRNYLSEEAKASGKKIAMQNYAHMTARSRCSSSVKDDTLNLALRSTGSWYIPETAVFHLGLDFVGLSSDKSGFNIEKKIDVTDSNGDDSEAYRVITEVGGAKSCPITETNKDAMADMLYDILVAYDTAFKNVDGSDMSQLLQGLTDFVKWYRVHSNSALVDTSLSQSEKAEAEAWADRAIKWIATN